MTDLAEFLLARITEDEAMVPEDNRDDDYGTGYNGYEGGIDVPPRRWLAECRLKRQIVELHATQELYVTAGCKHEPGIPKYGCGICLMSGTMLDGICDTLLVLAQPYADHPDHDPAWELAKPNEHLRAVARRARRFSSERDAVRVTSLMTGLSPERLAELGGVPEDDDPLGRVD